MKLSKILIIAMLAAMATIVYYSLSGGGSSGEDYVAVIKTERQEKDEFMKNSDESPFGADRASFTGLKYFEPNRKYRVNATLRSVTNKKVVTLPTSSGGESKYLEYAWAEFELDDAQNSLLLLEVMDEGPTRGTLFLAFADETSARETYGAGRYLELKKVAGASSLILDFNKAYNPYCAYVDSFSCPFPPAENILKIPIPAGEKNYH